MSTENALVALLREGVSVNEESVDSKRDLEDALRTACNDFIDHTCTSIAPGVIDLGKKLEGSTPESLATAAFFAASTVRQVLSQTLETLEVKAGETTSQMSLYLDNPATQSILLKPISKKVSKGLEEVRRAASGRTAGENGWDDSTRSEILLMIDDLEKSVKKAARASR
jgi:conserved oligomeric Golgi complex subunit 3